MTEPKRPDDPSLAVTLKAVPDADINATKKTANRREETLHLADVAVNGDRNVSYGNPDADFKRTAAYWNIHLNGVLSRKLGGGEIDPRTKMALADLFDSWDVAIMVNLIKTSRLAWSPQHMDNWVDMAGYAACGSECIDIAMMGDVT